MERNRTAFFVLALTVAVPLCSAFDDTDFQYWSTTQFSAELTKDWQAVFEEEFKCGDGGGHLYYHHSDLGFVYRNFFENVDVGFNFREVFERDSEGTWRREHRPHLNITPRFKFWGLDMSDRSRLEYRDREIADDIWRYRNKLTVRLPWQFTALKLQPYFADEVFINLNEEGFNRNRLYAGTTMEFFKGVSGEVFWLWQGSRSGSNWSDVAAIGTRLRFDF